MVAYNVQGSTSYIKKLNLDLNSFMLAEYAALGCNSAICKRASNCWRQELTLDYSSNNGCQMFCSTYCNVDVVPGKYFFRILFLLLFIWLVPLKDLISLPPMLNNLAGVT